MAGRITVFVGEQLARYLSAPMKAPAMPSTHEASALVACLRPGDVLLVEGNSRVSSAIKYLTQSTWSHAALYVGPIEGRAEPDGEPHAFVEAEIGLGVFTSPVSRHAPFHTRICRPIGLRPGEIESVIGYALGRVGHQYDIANIIDLARYLLPNPPVPTRFRRRMLALGSGSPTRAICSTLIAQAYQSVGYPILPTIERGVDGAADIWHIRHHSLFAPRDFDISPYFAIVKPTLEMGFDPSGIAWKHKQPTSAPIP